MAIILSMWSVFIGVISYGIGNYQYTLENWIVAFSLPVWSILTVGFWYDTGRLLFGSTLDSRESKTSVWIRYFTYTVWMAGIFTYIIWVHLELQLIQMLIVIPFLGIPLKRFLVQDYNKLEIPSTNELLTLLLWCASSYSVYWILTFAWIVFRVTILEPSSDAYLIYIN